MDDKTIVFGSMAFIGITGTIVNLSNNRNPFPPIAGALVGMIILGGVSTFAPQVSKGLAIVALLSMLYKYGPDLFALLGGGSGSRSGGKF